MSRAVYIESERNGVQLLRYASPGAFRIEPTLDLHRGDLSVIAVPLPIVTSLMMMDVPSRQQFWTAVRI